MLDRSLDSRSRIASLTFAAVIAIASTSCASGGATPATSAGHATPQRTASQRNTPTTRPRRDSTAARRPAAAPAGMDVLKDRDSTSMAIDVSDGFAFLTGAATGRPGVFMFDTGSPDLFMLNRHVVPLDSATRSGQVTTPFGKTVDAYVNKKIGQVLLRTVVYPNVGDVRSADLETIDEKVRPDFLGLIGFPLIKDVAFKLDYDHRRLTLFQLDSAGAPKVSTVSPSSVLGVLHFTTSKANTPEVTFTVGGTQLPATFDTGTRGSLTLTDATRKALETAGVLHVAKDSVTLDHASADSVSFTIPVASVTTGAANHLAIGTRFFERHPTVWNFRARTLTVLRGAENAATK